MVRAAFFDLDKTILDTSSNVALSGPFIEAGLMNRRTALTSVLVQLPYLLAGADESRMEQMAQALGRMGRGWNAAFLEATVEDALERTIQPVCYAQALARIEAHKRAGDVVVIASASVEQVVRPIAQMLGADEVLSSRAAVDSSMLTCFFSSFALPILFLLCPTAGVCGVMSAFKFYPKLVSSAFLGLRLQNRSEAPRGPSRRNSSVAGALYHFRERAHFLRLLAARGLRLLDAYLFEANRPPRLALYELGYID